MTNNNYKNYLEAINEIIVKNNNAIKELQRANMDLMNTFKSMVNAEATAPTYGLETRILCGDREQHEMVRIEFKFDSNVVTRLVYEVDEMDFKKVPNIIMSCLRNGGGVIDIDNIGSIEIEYFDWDGKGAIFVNRDTESLINVYTRFMHIAKM